MKRSMNHLWRRCLTILIGLFLKEYEKEDTTIGSKELACTAGVCEMVDIEAS